MLNQIGGAIHGAIRAVGAVAGAVLGGGGGGAVLGGNTEQGQNHREQAQRNDDPPSASSDNAPPNPNASVMDPAYILTDSISERLGVNNNGNPQKEQVVDESQEEEDNDNNEEHQAPHPLFDTTADRMPYAPGQKQILGDSTMDRLQLPVVGSNTRDGTTPVSEETTEASGRGYSTGEESSPFLSSFGSFTNDGTPTSPSPASMHPTRSEEEGLDTSALSPITNANSTHIHRASIASPNLRPDEGTAGHEDRELGESVSINGASISASAPLPGLDISAQDHNGSHSGTDGPTDDDNFPIADDSTLETLDTEDDTTDSIDDKTDPETSTSTTRSGRNYASTSTIVRSSSKRKDIQQQQPEADAATKRLKVNEQSRQASILSSDLTTLVFAVKAIYNPNTEKFIVKVQTVLNGPYLEASGKDIITLRKMGHAKVLEDVRQKALEKGEAHSAISSGAKSEPDETKDNVSAVETTELKCLGSVPMRATGMYCATDAITNLVHGAATSLYTDDLGETLRSFCDGDGKIDMKSLSAKVNDETKRLRLELRRLKKLKCGTPFGNASPHLRQEAIIDLASNEMLIVDYFSKRHSKARGHVVGVANGKVYDNDETTGGIFDLHAYAAREWDGIYAVRIVVPHKI